MPMILSVPTAFLLLPTAAFAQGVLEPSASGAGNALFAAAAFLLLSAVLIKLWCSVFRHGANHEPEPSVKGRAYAPSVHVVVATVACTAGLFFLALRTMGGVPPFDGPDGQSYAAAFFGLVGVIGVIAEFFSPQAKHTVFAFTVGTVVTFILIGFQHTLFAPDASQNPFLMALGIVCVIGAWKFLFGPWSPAVKATALGTFVLWLAVHLVMSDPPGERTARVLAAGIALVPATIWCVLFLKDHMQRLSIVILMFLSGMLSTAPILFYDALVRHHAEFQFFLFRIVPENFTSTSNAFVNGNLVGITAVKSTLAVTFISFLLVGVIEESSKFWVLRKSGRRFFASIDDVMQLGIIVAIGFAFAENVLNPTYFMAFVRQYLIYPASPDWGAFIGNVLGRAILTNMVHILATGVLGYCYGLALFADSYLDEGHKHGALHLLPEALQYVFEIPEKQVFRLEVLLTGFLSAVGLHGLFNFLVTLPDLLPTHPQTLGDLFGSAAGSPFHHVALLIIPSLFYVVGGFWLLSVLFYRKESLEERGCMVERDTLVKPQAVYS